MFILILYVVSYPVLTGTRGDKAVNMFRATIDEVDMNAIINSIFHYMIKNLFPDFECQKRFPVFGCPDQVNPYLYIPMTFLFRAKARSLIGYP
jgi:hypothetical protein